MKYAVIVYDGAADEKIEELGGKTPFEAADKPMLDMLARRALVGTVSNVPHDMVPESDTANLGIMSYDPRVYSKGRSPLEAVSMGLTMTEDQIAFRCNVVTVSDDNRPYAEKDMIDHSADEISTEEARELILAVQEALGNDERHFYPGISYRHCLLWHNPPAYGEFARPHDILTRPIKGYLPGEPYRSLYEESYKILNHHPVNEARRARGLRPANSIWLWSPGAKPALPSFEEKWGLKAAVISAVDLIKGIGLCAGMASLDVEGATGNIHTNFRGKGEKAVEAFKDGYDFVYVHVEAPDESGHRAEVENKVLSIEKIDSEILTPVYEYLKSTGEPFRIMILPDHPTPVRLRTHTIDPVPFMIWRSDRTEAGVPTFNEETAYGSDLYIPHGYELMALLTSEE